MPTTTSAVTVRKIAMAAANGTLAFTDAWSVMKTSFLLSIALGIVIVVWLLIGVVAAAQRGYFGNNNDVSCKTFGDTALTIVAGPLNYIGVNPKVKCSTPQPSK